MPNAQEKFRSRALSAFNRYDAIMRRATDLQEPFKRGKRWYRDAHRHLSSLATAQIPVRRIAGAAALLSPMTPWSRNLNGAQALTSAIRQQFPREWIEIRASRHTVYNKNARKAVAFILGETDEINGPKVRSFYRNLLGIFEHVTVDSWMYKIVGCFGLSSQSPTDNARRAISTAVKMCASRWDVKPAEAQAIIWVTARNFS